MEIITVAGAWEQGAGLLERVREIFNKELSKDAEHIVFIWLTAALMALLMEV